ncbi:MAG: amidohydrolase family protein [Pseudomonadota bacterium]
MADRRMWVAEMGYRDEWLEQVVEDVIEPEREIIDPHHHLWVRGGGQYMLEELRRDTSDGHNVVGTMYIECFNQYREDGPEHLRPLGETEYIAPIIEEAAKDGPPIIGYIGHADLRSPLLDEILDAHLALTPTFRGIRHAGCRDPEPEPLTIPGRGPEGLYKDEAFLAGVRRLGERGLTYDTWNYHHQIRDIIGVAKAAPETSVILDHFGTPLGVGRFEGKRDEIFEIWKDDVAALAECPNVHAKLGGMAMIDNGYGWHDRAAPPSSNEFVEAQAKWFHHMIACFGPDRCMFESNFPVDRVSISYRTLWNAFKNVAADYDEPAKQALFHDTAKRVYAV